MFSSKTLTILLMSLYFTSRMKMYVSSDLLTDLQQTINEKVEIKPVFENKYFTDVIINSDYKYRIYVYDFNKTSKETKNNKTNMFFIQMNCEFADWTQYKLFTFIEQFPTFLLNKINDYPFKRDIETNIMELTDIKENVERFVNTLQYFLDIASPYYDLSLLKTLISLNFKIEYILNYGYNKEQLNVHNIDSIIINVLLEIMFSIQNFKTSNCPLDNYSKFNEMKQFYGLWISQLPILDTSRYIHRYLDILESEFKLKTSSICRIQNWLLESIIVNGLADNEINLHEISSAKIIVHTDHKSYKKTIKEMFDNVRQNHDLELINLYTESIFDTIVKLISTKALKTLEEISLEIKFCTLKDYNLSDDVFETFKTINSLILHGINHTLPSDLISCFSSLAKRRKHTYNNIKKSKRTIQNYLNSIQNIILLDAEKMLDETESEKPIDKHKISLSLFDFINTIKQYTIDLQCFKRLYEMLHREYNYYYVPFINNLKKIDYFMSNNDKIPYSQKYLFDKDVEQVSDECYYIKDFKHLCFGVNFLLDFTDFKKQTNSTQVIIQMFKTFNKLSTMVIDKYWGTEDRDFLKISCNIHVFLQPNIAKYNEQNVRPLLFAIMTNLNNYLVEHCGLPNKSYSLYHKMSLNLNKILQFSEHLLKNKIFYKDNELVVSYDNNNYKALDIISFYNQSVKTTPLFIRYGEQFIFFWRGEKMNIYEIFENIESIVLNPLHILGFYEIYFKFIITALYYEITVIFDELKLNYEDGLNNKINTDRYQIFHENFKICIMKDNYPNYFSEFLKEIESLLSYVFDILFKIIIDSKFVMSNKSTSSYVSVSENDVIRVFNKEEVTNNYNENCSLINKIKLKITKKQINDFGIFMSEETNSNTDILKQPSIKINNFLSEAMEKGKQILMSKELCDSVKLVNVMIREYIPNI